jgi:hypothetical protein
MGDAAETAKLFVDGLHFSEAGDARFATLFLEALQENFDVSAASQPPDLPECSRFDFRSLPAVLLPAAAEDKEDEETLGFAE